MAAVMMAVCSMAWADSFSFLTVAGSDNSEQSFTLSEIDKITFSENNMVVHMTDGSQQTVALPGLSRMFFSNQAAGIELASSEQPSMRMADGVLTVSRQGGAHIVLYDVKGNVVKQVKSGDAEISFNLRGLGKGVYIVRVNGESRKIMNR